MSAFSYTANNNNNNNILEQHHGYFCSWLWWKVIIYISTHFLSGYLKDRYGVWLKLLLRVIHTHTCRVPW